MIRRVLMIAPTPFFGDRGCHTQIYEQARSLQKLGVQVRICTYPLGRNLPGLDLHRTWKPPGVKIEKIGPSREKYLLDILLFQLALKQTEEFQPDIIHGHLHEGALIGCAIRSITGTPVLFDLQGSLTGEMMAHKYLKKSSLTEFFFRQLEEFIDQSADIVATKAASLKKELHEEFHLPQSKVHLIMDGVDVENFKPNISCEDLRTKYQIPNQVPVIVYLGLLNEYQGVDLLLESIPEVLKRLPSVLFLIMGYPNEEVYRQKSIRLQIPEANIRFTGRIPYEEAARHLCLGQMAVSPKMGITEANGKLYNYMACALPTVAFDTSVNLEILGETGVYASLGNSSSLAQKMIELLENPNLRTQLGKAARNRVASKFSWDAVACRLMECYEKVQ